MSLKPDLLTKENLIRHFTGKAQKLNIIKSNFVNTGLDELLCESLLVTVVSYLEAAVIDTIKEYVYARPYEFIDKAIDLIKRNCDYKVDMDEVNDIGYEKYLLDEYLSSIAFKDNSTKIKVLNKIADIDIDLSNKNWEHIRECVARRNCFIHNDLIANGIYFKQAGQEAENIERGNKLKIEPVYLENKIDIIINFLNDIIAKINLIYKDNTNKIAVENLWDYLFNKKYPLNFDNCWNTEEEWITYKGPSFGEIENSMSLRTACLFSAWMSFFNGSGYRDLKYFSDIFCNGLPIDARKPYSEKLKYLIDCYEKIDFQNFKVKIYDKD